MRMRNNQPYAQLILRIQLVGRCWYLITSAKHLNRKDAIMLQLLAGKDASEDKRSVRFERHRPELTLLYRLVEQYYPDFEAQWASEGRVLPDYVRQEFDEYL